MAGTTTTVSLGGSNIRLGNASPEDAAKIFMREASKGLANVLAAAVAKALSETAGANADLGNQWTQYVTQMLCDVKWSCPPSTQLGSICSFSDPMVGGTDAQLGGVSVSVGISASF